MAEPLKNISEEALDNIVHAISEELKKENITLNSDELTILNDGVESILFHGLGIEAE